MYTYNLTFLGNPLLKRNPLLKSDTTISEMSSIGTNQPALVKMTIHQITW